MSNGKKFNVFNVMEKAADAIGVDFSKIGEDITGMSIEQISKLPLKERKIAVSKLGEKAPDWMLKNLFGENWLGAKLMARYVGGSGEDYHLDISKKDWKELISIAKDEADIVGGWTPSTNPNFPAEKGWEYVRYVQSGLMQKGSDGTNFSHIYNALGETTIRRRKLKKGKYEYQIAGETFDFIRGDNGEASIRGRDVLGRGIYGAHNARTVSDKGAKLINDLFPEHTSSIVYGGSGRAEISSKQTMEDFGTPFRILSKYIGK